MPFEARTLTPGMIEDIEEGQVKLMLVRGFRPQMHAREMGMGST